MVGDTGMAAQELHRRGVLLVEQGGRGGVADYTACLGKALVEQGVPVTIATAEDHLFELDGGMRIVPIFAYVRGHSRAGSLARRLHLGRVVNGIRFLLAMPRLVSLARRSAVVHVQGWERSSLGLIATAMLLASGARIVYTAHNTFERRAGSLDSTRIFGALARQTIVHTAADRNRMSKPAAVIPHGHYGAVANGARPVAAEDAREALGLPAGAFVVLLFGVLRPDKGLNDLLRALVHAPQWHALIAGKEEGALRTARELLHSPELTSRATVREGFHEIDAVGQFFAAADLIALPYQRASQSGVLYMAYGFGRPVAAYPVGGLAEAVIDGQTGWVCEQPTPAALAAVMREAAAAGRDELRRRGEEGRRWAAETFDWNRIAQATETVYRSALER